MIKKLRLLFADDDEDDRTLFKDALRELPISAELTTACDGKDLMNLLLKKSYPLPHLLFLDLNMPRKNGFECLSEIKLNEKLKKLPVIIFSTSFQQEVADLLYKQGALFYIRKPSSFSELKNLIHKAIIMSEKANFIQPPKKKFVITPEGTK